MLELSELKAQMETAQQRAKEKLEEISAVSEEIRGMTEELEHTQDQHLAKTFKTLREICLDDDDDDAMSEGVELEES